MAMVLAAAPKGVYGEDHMPRTRQRSPLRASAYRKADVHHPLRGGADGLRAYALGIAPAAAGDRGRRPPDPCDFLKKIE